jgi:hypothetical protein
VKKPARREIIRRGVQILSAFPLLRLIAGGAEAAESCSDSSSGALRESLHYSDAAQNPAQSCNACGFFSPAPDKPSCGNCMIMSDHVNPKGHCDSWAARN